MPNIVILISGRGSNMEAILNAGLECSISAVISNNPTAGGIDIARQAGIPTQIVDHKLFPSRVAFDDALCKVVRSHQPDWVVLAGFMRVLSAGFIGAFPNRIINIHPSLLPSFPGLHTHERAFEAGVKIHGATVHLVTPELDNGPIIAQAAVPVLAGDSAASLGARVLEQEHLLYPAVLRELLSDGVEYSTAADRSVLRIVARDVNRSPITTRADAALRAPWT